MPQALIERTKGNRTIFHSKEKRVSLKCDGHLTCMKFAAVINLDSPSTSFQSVTRLSGIFHKRSFPSNEADKKN